MQVIRAFLAWLSGANSRLSWLEKQVLDCVRARLDDRIRYLWDRQVQTINKVQRLPNGVEVDFYRMSNGRPSFDGSIAFPNKREVALATVSIEMNGLGTLDATVWSVNGFMFSIEYKGSVGDFEEAAAGMDPLPGFRISCGLTADLLAA
ncbi:MULTISPECIES: hypothetical protein [unclassified Bradyrhizobium]|uniref:hypothetical protein n=1 Tax=unclassified Bradyrhizobium TaxID=2631580 RepID=UPI0029165CA2|nr:MULTISPECIES: hypothetical protein [unclassified Bradyrhizobium]